MTKFDIKTIVAFLEASRNLLNNLKEDLDKNPTIDKKFNTGEKYLMMDMLIDSTNNIDKIIGAIKRRIK